MDMTEAATEVVASRLLEMLGKDATTSGTNLRLELNLLNASIDEISSLLWSRGWVKRMREVSELIEDAVDEFCAFPAPGSGFISYLSRPLTRRPSPPNTDSIRALLIDGHNDFNHHILNDDRLFEPFRVSIPSKELFLQAISPVVASLIRNYLVGLDPLFLAVSVLGIGGAGGDIFSEVYDDEAVKIHFDFRARIQEPPTTNIHHAMKSVAKQICAADQRVVGEIDAMNFREVVATIRRLLRSKRYFLAFEDVSTVELWFVIREALPEDNNGSRVVITTRSERVASACNEVASSSASEPEPLSEEMVWKIFSNITLERSRAAEFPEVLDMIFEWCKEMPLANVAVAGLLLTNNIFPQVWRKLIRNFNFEVEPNQNLKCLSEILALGFYNLPHQIKSCFLYFSLFPKDSLVPNEELLKLWIAEDFIPEETGRSLEEIAQNYLNQLIERNLVQACEGFYGIENFSRVHCLMLEFLHQEAAERNFCQTYGIHTGTSLTEKSRRLVISNHGVENIVDSFAESRVRTIFLSTVGALTHSTLVGLFERYKLLTLLDIDNSPLELLPEEVGDLSYLKHLRLRNTQLRTLPKSMGKLQKLQTLDLTRTLLAELPMEIFMLRNLRHLLASRCDNRISLDPAKGVKMKAGIRYLPNLLTLTTVEAHLSGTSFIQELKKLKKMRSLSVSRLTSKLTRALCFCIEEMRNLKSLRLHSMNNESLDLLNISYYRHPHLEHLVLKGLLQKFPEWISNLPNLRMLCLSLSRLTDDPLQNIYLLSKLETLWLYRAYERERLHFREEFPSLKLLVLRDLQGLEAIQIEKGSLPLLEELRIGPSPFLKEVPFGINDLKNLREISFYDMPREFVLKMKPEEGSEYWKVKHIQSILIWFRDEGRRYISYKLCDADLWRCLEDLEANSNEFPDCYSRLSFSYSDDEEDSAVPSNFQWNDIARVSLSSDRFSFFTDDVEQ